MLLCGCGCVSRSRMFYASDDDVMFDLKSDSAEGRVAAILESPFIHNKIWKYKSHDGRWISWKPNFARKSHAEQFVFMNRRFIFPRWSIMLFFSIWTFTGKRVIPFFILNLTLIREKSMSTFIRQNGSKILRMSQTSIGWSSRLYEKHLRKMI